MGRKTEISLKSLLPVRSELHSYLQNKGGCCLENGGVVEPQDFDHCTRLPGRLMLSALLTDSDMRLLLSDQGSLFEGLRILPVGSGARTAIFIGCRVSANTRHQNKAPLHLSCTLQFKS